LDASALEEQENAWGLLSTAEWTTRASEQGNGGLHNAIRVGIREGAIGNLMWVGTLGMPIDSLTEPTRSAIAMNMQMVHDCLTVFVDDNTFEGYYTQFCRSVLWPVLHYQMQEGPRHAEYEEFSWDQYVKVNEAFADVIIREWKKGDTIWVFDYHLLLLPEILRSRLPRPDIGFFLTTPFPSYEVFRCLFSREKLLNGMLGADLVSFQAEEYQKHFIQCCCRLLGLETVKSALQVKQRLVRVWYESLQIDSVFLQRVRQTSDVKAWMTAIGNKYKGKRLIAARDRLDAPGGVKHKLLAYERFLKRYPKWRHTVR
jgi:trehalose 6-phosphate synthase/phosphatase